MPFFKPKERGGVLGVVGGFQKCDSSRTLWEKGIRERKKERAREREKERKEERKEGEKEGGREGKEGRKEVNF